MTGLKDSIAAVEMALRGYRHMLRAREGQPVATDRLSEVIAEAGGCLRFHGGYRIDFDGIEATSVIGPEVACRYWLKKARKTERAAA